jgi:hypothetical protein
MASSGEAGKLQARVSSRIACETVREASRSKFCFGVDRWVRSGGSSGAALSDPCCVFAITESLSGVLSLKVLGVWLRSGRTLIGVTFSIMESR